MSFTGLLTMSCDLVLRDYSTGQEDEHGSPVPVETTLAERCYLSRQAHTETGDPQTQVETFALYLDPDAPVTGWDAVDVGGARYELIGPPEQVVQALSGRVHHVEATLRRSDPERSFA